MENKNSITIDSRGEGIENLDWLVGKVINTENIITDSDYGDCCGWADIDVIKDTFNGDVLITNVTYEESSNYDCQDIVIITLYGQNKEIYELNLSDGSGSGWDYGSVATVEITVNQKDSEKNVWNGWVELIELVESKEAKW